MQAEHLPETGRDNARTSGSPALVPPLQPSDVRGLLDAMPIAAGVFGTRKNKLWIHALNARFLELAIKCKVVICCRVSPLQKVIINY